MSFILDALKKSEQERRRRGIPDLHTDHAPMPTPRGRTAYWPIWIALALLLNAGLLLWWLRPWQPPIQTENQAPQVMKTEQPVPPAAPAGTATASVTTVSPTTEKETPPLIPSALIESVQVPEVVVSPASMAVPIPAEQKDLPPELRAELPEIDISLHFFTTSPPARMVRINGRNLREGQQVNPNLILQEITPEGVVLDFKGHVFSAGR